MSAKQEVIKNVFDSSGTQDRMEKKYLQYVQDFQGAAVKDALTAFRTKDINFIEVVLKKLAESRNTALFLIGIGAVIIEREKLYLAAGYRSYIEYTQHLFDDLNIPVSTLSDDKIIMENFIDYHKPLSEAGFKLERNANKLRYLQEAIKNHGNTEEVFNRIAKDSFRTFKDWAQQRSALIQHKPEPEIRVEVEIDGDRLLVDGQNILHFPRGTSEKIKKMVGSDLAKTFSIRESGHIPYILGTYNKGEQIALENFLKKYRAKK